MSRILLVVGLSVIWGAVMSDMSTITYAIGAGLGFVMLGLTFGVV